MLEKFAPAPLNKKTSPEDTIAFYQQKLYESKGNKRQRKKYEKILKEFGNSDDTNGGIDYTNEDTNKYINEAIHQQYLDGCDEIIAMIKSKDSNDKKEEIREMIKAAEMNLILMGNTDNIIPLSTNKRVEKLISVENTFNDIFNEEYESIEGSLM